MAEPTTAQRIPTGTITLLLGDIEGSTRLWETRPDDMTSAMTRFTEVLAGSVPRHQGVLPIEQGEGDSFVAAFGLATDAVACAIELQLEWGRASWPFRVRLALHTGAVQTREGERYEGPTIIRCARLRSIAHGGQTVLSRPTHDLVVDHMPAGAWLDDMGVHHLKDMDRPERVHQLRHPDLALNPAPLLWVAAVGHLPVSLTSFVGREREIDTVLALMQANRIVSVLGVGGCGKTRLSVEVASRALPAFPDGVWFVELAPIDEPDLTAHTVLTTIGGREQPGRSATETILDALTGRTVLLVMDNCEHVVAAAARVSSDLLSGTPTLSVLATSREQLGVAGEVTFPLPSLSIDAEALELFADRASKARPGFAVTDDNAAAVREICQRLDGIPLALELAAARIRALSPQQICDGLSDRFRLLSTGARTLLPRHQTLRGSVDWSYDLLTEDERAAGRRLSIFSGGFDLDAAQAVVADDRIEPVDVLDLVGSLVDKSLVIADDRGHLVRYRMLETIREYGAERIDEADERSEVARRHRAHYQALLERASAEEEGSKQAEWRARVMAEMDNIRAALNSALEAGDGAALIALTCGAGNTWTLMGRSTEHHRWLAEALARAPDDSPFLPEAVYQLGIADQFVGDLGSSHRHLGEAVELYLASGNEVGALWPLAEYAFTVAFRDGLDAAMPLLEDGIVRARAIGADVPRFYMELSIGQFMVMAGRAAQGREQLETALTTPAPVEHFRHWASLMLALCNATLGDLDRAGAGVDEPLAYARGTGDRMTLGMGLWVLTHLRVAEGRLAEARTSAAELEAVVLDLSPLTWWASVMHSVAELAVADGDNHGAIRVCEEAILRMRQAAPELLARYLATKGEALASIGDLDGARRDLAVVVDATASEAGPSDRVRALVTLAHVERREGRPDDAENRAHEALTLSRPMGHKRGVVDALEVLAYCAVDAQSPAEAARLLGAADALRRVTGYQYRPPLAQRPLAESIVALDAALSGEGRDQAWAEGEALDLEDACDYAARGRGGCQ